ncbi:MAG TPA: hypothetical protein VI358_19025 [Pseudolabrys sp.]
MSLMALIDIPTAPAFVRYWSNSDIRDHPGEVEAATRLRPQGFRDAPKRTLHLQFGMSALPPIALGTLMMRVVGIRMVAAE